MKDNEVTQGKNERVWVEDYIECDGKKITYEELIDEYGPEGLYEIAARLHEIADKDVSDAIKETRYCPYSDGKDIMR